MYYIVGMEHSDDKKLPKPTAVDYVHTAIKAGLSMIPVAGGPASELFNTLIVPPLAKRRDAWLTSLSEELIGLQEKVDGFTLDSLFDNDVFVTAVMHGTQAALRNHQKEKIDALRNAVLNVATGNSPDEDLQIVFLNFIDTATTWHLRLLKFFQDPATYGRSIGITFPDWSMGGVSTVLAHTFPELRDRKEFYETITTDLNNRGFISGGSSMLNTTMSESGMFSKRTTAMGDTFLAFIEE